MQYIDSYKHKGMRKTLIDSLYLKGIEDERVLDAMSRLPRHFFLDKAFEEKAYQDIAFPIGADQTISQPYTVAFQTSLLELQEREKVLEIGTGSGYQACVLALMGARVFTIERQEELYLKTKKLLDFFELGIRTYWRDGYKGLPELAPFDKILVTCGANEIPDALLTQLKIGGALVIPVGNAENQSMLKIIRKAEDDFTRLEYGDFSFVPFLKGVAKKSN